MLSALAEQAVLVTGGAGAIGSRLVRRLLEEGAPRVAVVDDLSSGFRWLLPRDPRLELHVADVATLPALGLALERPLVFHLAALFANQKSVERPLLDLQVNGAGTLTALLSARGQQARRFVYASAGCSLAGHAPGPIHEDLPVSLHLDTPYQITKALGEFYANYFLPELSTVRCRFFNCYGPGEVPGAYRNVVPNFIWRALHGQPLVITGSGEETRDFVFVEDLVEGLLRAASVPGAHGLALNLGTGVQTRVLDLAEAVLRLTRSASRLEFAPRRPWDKAQARLADVSRSRAVLGFVPRVGLEEGLERTLRWFHDEREAIAEAVAGR